MKEIVQTLRSFAVRILDQAIESCLRVGVMNDRTRWINMSLDNFL
jgi:hypothetical protein